MSELDIARKLFGTDAPSVSNSAPSRIQNKGSVTIGHSSTRYGTVQEIDDNGLITVLLDGSDSPIYGYCETPVEVNQRVSVIFDNGTVTIVALTHFVDSVSDEFTNVRQEIEDKGQEIIDGVADDIQAVQDSLDDFKATHTYDDATIDTKFEQAEDTITANVEASIGDEFVTDAELEIAVGQIESTVSENYQSKTDAGTMQSNLQSQITQNANAITQEVSDRKVAVTGAITESKTYTDTTAEGLETTITENVMNEVGETYTKQADFELTIDGFSAEFTAAIGEVDDKAEAAQSTANTAKSTADSAASTASTANTNATTAQTTANQAKTAASTAQSTAEAAQSTANTANTNATEAKSAASTANTNATQAKSDAATALSTANNAQTAANDAAKTATNFIAYTASDGALSIGNKIDSTNKNELVLSPSSIEFKDEGATLASFSGTKGVLLGKAGDNAVGCITSSKLGLYSASGIQPPNPDIDYYLESPRFEVLLNGWDTSITGYVGTMMGNSAFITIESASEGDFSGFTLATPGNITITGGKYNNLEIQRSVNINSPIVSYSGTDSDTLLFEGDNIIKPACSIGGRTMEQQLTSSNQIFQANSEFGRCGEKTNTRQTRIYRSGNYIYLCIPRALSLETAEKDVAIELSAQMTTQNVDNSNVAMEIAIVHSTGSVTDSPSMDTIPSPICTGSYFVPTYITPHIVMFPRAAPTSSYASDTWRISCQGRCTNGSALLTNWTLTARML